MVEVFKTNVEHQHQASMLVEQLHQAFDEYMVNFDLDDCDKILRVRCINGFVIPLNVINLVKQFGFTAELLPDEPVSVKSNFAPLSPQWYAVRFNTKWRNWQ